MSYFDTHCDPKRPRNNVLGRILGTYHFGTIVATSKVQLLNIGIFKEEKMEEGKSVASNFIWALAMVIIVGMLAAALYYGGIFGGTKKHDIDVEIKVPSATNN
ncbi:hypothetical protein [Leptolyngbya sp. 7M]|uniref:hypothetical protein n=1 Tax=Leptolyngbya sp. 7M TaxID=2812896 RepID=UPI001B8C1A17|nr:hypothetical protein [Leptolyngbya sp. 7M]QYO65825.1 hypothetical protein JVX88_03235 [Leptolyngbya sp. 7M]